MAVLPNNAEYMASTLRNTTPECETFHKFFDCWLSEQNQNLQQLFSASKDHQRINTSTTTSRTEPTRQEDERVLRLLIHRVIQHYEDYYRAKSRWAKQDVIAMLSPSWTSTLEDAFLWIGGWRPSMAFHLLYSKSGLQLEDRLADVIRGLNTGDLADLSQSQLTQVDESQRETIREEKEITEMMAKLQETVADSSMVELSHAVTDLNQSGQTSQNAVGELEDDRVELTLAPKQERLEEILERADGLRLRTLRAAIDVLTPIQAVHFLIAAAELHLRLHDWGKKRDARHGHVADGTQQNH